VEITFAFDASLDASARASFNAKMEALKANIGVMLSSTTRYEALFEAQGGADMSAAAAVQAELESVVSAVGDGSALADIPIGRLPCLINELGASVTIVGNIIDTASADLEAQAAFAASFATGFGTQG
jgi:hypothetical protein